MELRHGEVFLALFDLIEDLGHVDDDLLAVHDEEGVRLVVLGRVVEHNLKVLHDALDPMVDVLIQLDEHLVEVNLVLDVFVVVAVLQFVYFFHEGD